MGARIFSTLYWGFGFSSSAVMFGIALVIFVVTAPFDRRGVVLHRFTCFWASMYTWLHPSWFLSIEGREHVEPGRAYVIVANHQSTLDILVLFRLFVHFKWVAKAESFLVPFIGWNMWLNRYVRLRRGDRRSVVSMMKRAERVLREGSSILIFPEGTRSRDGALQPFKQGAFSLAKRAGVSILPIVIEGTGNALPRRGFVFAGRHSFRMRVLPPIPYDSFATASVADLTTRVRALYADELSGGRARSAAAA
jgi:1-acyl-sn-glycerol-3-phosphate acyltransferase